MDKTEESLSSFSIYDFKLNDAIGSNFVGAHYAAISDLDENYLYFIQIRGGTTRFNLGLIQLTPASELTTVITSTAIFNWGDNSNYGFRLNESKDRNGVVFRGVYDINGNLGIGTNNILYAIKVLKIN